MTPAAANFTLLLVEDDPLYAELTSTALAQASTPPTVHQAENGESAIAFLRSRVSARQPPVDLVLLDLRLPTLSGQETLAEIKQDETLKRIPVVILTSSVREEDVLKAYQAGANAYITKPKDYFSLAAAAESLCHFWGSLVSRAPN